MYTANCKYDDEDDNNVDDGDDDNKWLTLEPAGPGAPVSPVRP